jgi:hypothetical protein
VQTRQQDRIALTKPRALAACNGEGLNPAGSVRRLSLISICYITNKLVLYNHLGSGLVVKN